MIRSSNNYRRTVSVTLTSYLETLEQWESDWQIVFNVNVNNVMFPEPPRRKKCRSTEQHPPWTSPGKRFQSKIPRRRINGGSQLEHTHSSHNCGAQNGTTSFTHCKLKRRPTTTQTSLLQGHSSAQHGVRCHRVRSSPTVLVKLSWRRHRDALHTAYCGTT